MLNYIIPMGGVRNNLIAITAFISHIINKAVLTIFDHLPLFLLLTLYFTFPGFPTMVEGNGIYFIYSAGIFIISAFIFASILTFISSWNRVTYVLILLLFTLLAYGELFSYFSQNTRITFGILRIALQTDTTEAAYFLADPNVGMAMFKSLICLGSSLLFYVFLLVIWRKKRIANLINDFITKNRIIRTSFKLLLILCFTASCLINTYTWKTSSYNNIYIYASSPMTQILALKQLSDWRSSWDLEKLACTNNNAKIEFASPDSLTVVYAIGESHSRYHSSLYGYPWITDPNMRRLHSDSSLIVFDNVIAGYTYTSEIYPRLLSTHDLNSEEKMCNSPLLPTLLKKAGFITEYFNNQSLLGRENMDFSCNFIFSNPEILKQSFSTYNDKILNNELHLPTAFPVGNAVRGFTIYHFFGQHYPWDNYSDIIFHPKDYQNVQKYTNQERVTVAAYDNATYQVDKILDNLINQIKDKCSILVYVSDHGDRIYDYEHHYSRGYAFAPTMVKFVMEVPLYIYVSDKYMAKYPERVTKLRAAVHKPIFNTDIAHTIIDLAGIQTDAYNPNLSLLTPGIYRNERLLPQYGLTYESLLPQLSQMQPVYHLQ